MGNDRSRTAAAYDAATAQRAIEGLAVVTPVVHSRTLTVTPDRPVLLKLENLQVTGSFKVRGAANRLLALSPEQRGRGVVACSSGNHGRAVAYVARSLGVPATVCVPEWVDPAKLRAIRRLGAETVCYGRTYDQAEERSFEIQRERDLVAVHPFDDPYVIAGQGTIGLELLEQCEGLGTVAVPVSGGGLISGIAVALKSRNPRIRVVGVSARHARVMVESLQAGQPIAYPEEATVASALSGGIGVPNRHTFRLVRDWVDEHVLVSEHEIQEAMVFASDEHRLIVEGGGAVGLAAVLAGKIGKADGSLAVIISGGNIERTAWCRILQQVNDHGMTSRS